MLSSCLWIHPEVKYADFFAPPAKVFKPTGSNAKASSSSFKGKKVKSNAKPSFDEMDDDLEDEMMMDGEDGDEDLEMEDYDEDEAGSDDLDDGMDVTSRAKGDLFADDDDEDGDDDSGKCLFTLSSFIIYIFSPSLSDQRGRELVCIEPRRT